MSINNIFKNYQISIKDPFILNNFSIQNIFFPPREKSLSNQKQLKSNIINKYIFRNPNVKYYTPEKKIKEKSYYPTRQEGKSNQDLTKFTSERFLKLNGRVIPQMNKINNTNDYHISKVTHSKFSRKSFKCQGKNRVNNERIPQDSKKKEIFIDINNKSQYSNSFTSISLTEINRSNRYNILSPNPLNKKLKPKNSKSKEKNKYELDLGQLEIKEQIGKGTFGKIFSAVMGNKKKSYAIKIEELFTKENALGRKQTFKLIQNFTQTSTCKGLIKLYANLLLKSKYEIKYRYYELMEKAETDWGKEIIRRAKISDYYKEKNFYNIMNQLILTLAELQKNHITHRDIKPQNILIIDGNYKLSDFGEVKKLERSGLVIQRVRGSELFMSPLLFYGLHNNSPNVKHNTYKSDVFSLGMCFFFALALNYEGVDSIRELKDMKKVKYVMFNHLGNKYSQRLILFILSMLEIEEEKRPDFIELESKMKNLF